MVGGTYTLLVELPEATTIGVGALGEHRFPSGWYAYTGSALGSGGFSRVDRHYELAAGDRETRHWHIDYLLGEASTLLRGDVRTVDADVECVIAERLPEGPLDGFGASDCNCPSHLAYDADGGALRQAVADTHREVGGE